MSILARQSAGASAVLESLDVAVTAVRRPDIVADTFESFSRNLLSRIPAVRLRLVMNVDPLWGTRHDAERVVELAHTYFPRVTIRQPEKPSFCDAVRWIWSQVETQWFLHLEDDWVLLRPIDVTRLRREMAGKDVVFVRFNHKWNSPRTWLDRSRFTLTPSLIHRDVAEAVVPRLNDREKDPLDLISRDIIPSLQKPWRFRVHGPLFADRAVADVGIAWREARGIAKMHDKGQRKTWWSDPAGEL